jgi:hypothetical protein
MKIKSYYLFALLLILAGCDRKRSPEPSPSLETPFIRKATVAGAKEVVIDHVNRTIQIVLPQTFTSDVVGMHMDLVDGVNVTSGGFAVTEPIFTFAFKGSGPISMHINNNYSANYHTYKIYVDLEGKINAGLNDDLYVSEDGTCLTEIFFNTGIGTIPERPTESETVIATISDPKSNKQATGTLDPYFFLFQDAYKLLPADQVNLTITHKGEKFVMPEKVKFDRWHVRALFDSISTWWSVMPKNKGLTIGGGCFLQYKKYRLKLENAPQAKVVWVPVTYAGPRKLNVEIPDNITDGNYHVGLYEDEQPIAKFVYNITNKTEEKGIQQIWTGIDGHLTGNTMDGGTSESIKLNAGKDIYVNPFPMFIGTFDGPRVTVDKLPDLKITGSGFDYEIKPKLMEDRTFGDGALVLFYPSYTLPSDIKPGKYKIQLHYNDWGATAPFCKALEIK